MPGNSCDDAEAADDIHRDGSREAVSRLAWMLSAYRPAFERRLGAFWCFRTVLVRRSEPRGSEVVREGLILDRGPVDGERNGLAFLDDAAVLVDDPDRRIVSAAKHIADGELA